MKSLQKKIMFLFTTILFLEGYSQDIHFSSVGFNPMFFNPSMTAVMNNKYRVSTIYRNQWQTVSKGYNTFFVSMEMQPYISMDNAQGVGVGLSFTSDVAGSLSFGEKDIMIAASYFFALDHHNRTYLSVGVEGMKKNWTMNLSHAEFNPLGYYDDNVTYENLNTYDFSLGISLQHAPNEEHLFSLSAALFHINTPSLSRFKNEDVYMHRRLFASVSYSFPFNNSDKISLNPQVFYQHQHNFNEILFGSDLILKLNDAIFTSEIFTIGLYVRNLEAIVVSPKFKYNNFIAGVAYDANISKLSKVSKTYGAFEIWLSYAFNPLYNRQKQTKIPCPIF